MWNSIKTQFQEITIPFSYNLKRIRERLLKIFIVELVVRTIQELGEDDATHKAAGIAYYAIISLFPLLLGLIAILGFILPSEQVQEELLDFFERNLPGAIDVLEQNIDSVIKFRGTIGAVSLVLLLWSASAMFGAINRTVNRVWDIHKDRPFYIRKLRDIGMALGIGILFFLSMGATSVFSFLRNLDSPLAIASSDIGARLLAFLFSIAIFLLLYKFIPNTKTYWRYIWPGAVLAGILFEIAKTAFVFYLDHFASYESVYGNVASMIILLFWIYISAFIMILGAELSAEYGRMRMGAARGVLIAKHLEELEQMDSANEQSSEYISDHIHPEY
jgi:membrane protein